MAVSGKCYLSLHEMNASANRGACMQICRRAYSVKDKDSNIELDIENQYIMSPKDLKTIHFMNKMMDAGVRVFKIEGRARGPEYVRLVTECYKEAVRAYCNGTFDEKKVAAWDERLRSVFNRGFWDGYYLGQRLGEWSSKYGSGATKKKVYVAKGIMKEYIFKLTDKVRDYECDLQGVVNNSNYQHYMEHTRHEFLESLGENFGKMHEKGVDGFVSRVEIQYKTSLKSGDSYISCLNVYKKGVKLVFEQDIYRASDNALATKGIVESVIVENGKLTRGEYFDEMLKRIEHT